MKYPQSENLGMITGPDGRDYSTKFYGEDEGAAVVVGPSAHSGQMEWVKEVFREHAETPEEARQKIDAWRRAQGWPE
jgi:hypothetical protein